MTKLKLSAILDDRPVKVTIGLPAAVHSDLVAYAEVLGRETGQTAADPAKADRADAGVVHDDGPGVQPCEA
nr:MULTISPECIES: DUF2274 domain-containing protein [unclassified Mesorhizobium]